MSWTLEAAVAAVSYVRVDYCRGLVNGSIIELEVRSSPPASP